MSSSLLGSAQNAAACPLSSASSSSRSSGREDWIQVPYFPQQRSDSSAVNQSSIRLTKKQQQRRQSMKAMAISGGEGGGGGGVAKFKGTQMREKQLSEMIEKTVNEAKEVCQEDETSDECKVAWDEVEEISQAKADLRLKLEKHEDPLESFCQDNPETDECRVYED